MNTKKRIIAAAAAATLLLGGAASAHPGSNAGPDQHRAHRGMEGPRVPGGPGGFQGQPNAFHGGEFGPGQDRTGPRGIRNTLLWGLPLGTEVQIHVYDQEPADGVEPTTTLALTIGEDSEAAFLEQLASAREDAAYLVVEVGEQTRAIDLPDIAAEEGMTGLRGRPGMALGMIQRAGLDDGDTITAVFYDGNPDEGANALQTVAFTYGEDSAIGFQHELRDAGAEADWVVVTLPSRTQTIDLSERPARDGMQPNHRGFGFGRFGSNMR